MSATIKSGATTDVLTVDPTSKAARVTLYDTSGGVLASVPVTMKSGATADIWTIDPTSKAGRVTLYDTSGNALALDADVKGTQSTVGLGVQNLQDVGRTNISFFASNMTGTTTDTMVTTSKSVGGATASTGTTFAVTAGKTLRIQALMVSCNATSTTSVGGIVRVRISDTGSVTTSTPMYATCGAGLIGTQVAQCGTSNSIEFFGGLELSGTQQIGVSQQGIAVAGFNFALIGYEY